MHTSRCLDLLVHNQVLLTEIRRIFKQKNVYLAIHQVSGKVIQKVSEP